MAKLDIERVMTEYYMLKTVLKNKYAMDVVTGKVEPAGPTAAADKRTLQAMQRYVKTLDELVIPGVGLSAGENLETFLERVSKNFKEKEAAKPESKKLEYSENPFDDNFKHYVSALLDTENAKTRIEKAITTNKPVLDSINSLVVNLGGKKQSSYVKLLSQSTELFSTVSGLRSEIDKLTKTNSSNKERIKDLRTKLSEKTKEAQKYKELCDKAIDELGQATASTVLVGLLKETNNALEGVVRQEAQQTREHVTSEADRMLETIQRKDKIKSVLLSDSKTYPRYTGIYQGKELNNKGLKNLLNEIQYAAQQVGVAKDDSAVTSIYNDLAEQNLKNFKNNDREKNKSKGKKVVPIVAGVLLASLMATTAYFGIENHHLHNDLHNANETISQLQDGQGSDAFKGTYEEYVARENEQLNDYTQKLKIALEDGTFITIDNSGSVTSGVTNEEGSGWTKDKLDMLRDEYAKDDNAEFGWNSTTMMDAETEKAIQTEKANYFKNHYDEMVSQVETLNAKVAKLQDELNTAYSIISDQSAYKGSLLVKIDKLEDQVAELQAQVDNLQSIIDAGNGNSSGLQEKLDELQTKLDEANNTISELQAKNDELTAENAELKATISNLEGSVDSLNARVDELTSQNTVLATEKASLQLEVAGYKATISELQARLDSLTGTDAYEQIIALENKISDLEGKLEKAESTIDSLKSTNEELTNQIVELETNISGLEQQVKDLEKAVSDGESIKQEVSSLKEQLAKSMNDYNELYKQYQNLLQEGGWPQEIEDLQNKLNSAYETITSYEEQIVKLYNGITKENTSSSEAKKDLESLFKLFGIDYNEANSPSNDSSEYQP